jgi:hypothetical protein
MCPICRHSESEHFGLTVEGRGADVCSVEGCECERPW